MTRIRRTLVELLKPAIERHPNLARLYRDMREERDFTTEPVDTPLGFKFSGNRAMEQGTFEPEETAVVTRLLPQVKLFVNIGANRGYYCCLALRHDVHTIAIEPMPDNLRYLYRNIRANHWGNDIEVFPLALAAKSGLAEIFGGGTGASLVPGWAGISKRYVTVVPTSTLDSLLAPRALGIQCLILADIEGAELQMLAGAEAILRGTPKPIWFLEISVGHHQPAGTRVNPHFEATFRRFWESGYEACTADRHMRRVSETDVEAIGRTGLNSFGTQNFLFIESGRRNEYLPDRA